MNLEVQLNSIIHFWYITQLFKEMGAGIHEISMMSPLCSLFSATLLKFLGIGVPAESICLSHALFSALLYQYNQREQCGTVRLHSSGFANLPATLPYLFADEPARLPS